ncbi:BMP family ABC transporter substrate-binding protein [Mycoplasma sp. VS30B]
MKKIKSLLITVVGISAIALPVAAVSCNSESKPAKYIEPSKRITNGQIVEKDIEAKIKEAKSIPTVALVTESANVLDKSFNQSAWESVLTVYDQVKKAGKSMTIRPIEPDQSQPLETTYNSLLSQGIQLWILSGYKHSEELPKYINEHAAELNQKGVKIIGIDYSLDQSQLTEAGKTFKNCYCLEYKVQEPAYIVGQAVASYLAKYSTNNLKTTTFGGGDYTGVTAFINGYVKGIYQYDKTNNAKVSIPLPAKTNAINVKAGFDNNNTMKQVVLETIGLGGKVILPVAGTATSVVLDELTAKNSDTLIIGVDADQSKAFPGQEGRFFSSITKNIGKSVYDALLYTMFGLNEQGLFKDDLTGIHGSLAQGWVSYAPSTISNEEQRNFVNQELQKYETEFRNATKEILDFVDTDSTAPNTPAVSTVTGIAVANTVAAAVNTLASAK